MPLYLNDNSFFLFIILHTLSIVAVHMRPDHTVVEYWKIYLYIKKYVRVVRDTSCKFWRRKKQFFFLTYINNRQSFAKSSSIFLCVTQTMSLRPSEIKLEEFFLRYTLKLFRWNFFHPIFSPCMWIELEKNIRLFKASWIFHVLPKINL